ncbi:MAG: amidohydrolase family protein, partial [Gemmatimonadetes bacterium]|nr:amidohydrolase family protein [Gemmatimonadota bacterium]
HYDPVDHFAEAFAYHGVLALRDVGTEGEWMQTQRDRAQAGQIVSPRIFYSAGMLAEEHGSDGMNERATDPQNPGSIGSEVRSLAATGADVVKVRLRNSPFDARVSEATHALGVPLTSHYVFSSTVARGLEGKEHMELYYRDWTAIYRDDLLSTLRAGHVCVTATLLLYPVFRLRGGSTLFPLDTTLFSDPAHSVLYAPAAFDFARRAMREPISPRGIQYWDERFRRDLENVRRLNEAAVRVVTGTDSPPPWEEFGVHLEMELFVKAGLSPIAAIRAATLDAARCLGVEHELGSVEGGKLADLVVVDGDPATRIQDARRIAWIVLGGHLLTRQQILDSLRAAAMKAR